MPTLNHPAQATARTLTFEEALVALGPPPEEPQAEPVAPLGLEALLSNYHAATAEAQAAYDEREKISDALSQAREEQCDLALRALPRLKQDFEDSILTENEGPAKLALTEARSRIAQLTERISILTSRQASLPSDDFGKSNRVSQARSEILHFISNEVLRRFPPSSLLILQEAFSVQQRALGWGDFLGSVLPMAEDRGAVAAAVMSRYKVDA